jgi:hypothetical protein
MPLPTPAIMLIHDMQEFDPEPIMVMHRGLKLLRMKDSGAAFFIDESTGIHE